MLNPDELKDALHDAMRAAAPACTRFCQYSIRVEDGKVVVSHNGVSDRTSDWQIVYSDKVLALSKDGLSAKLKAWVNALHKGERVDLNAAMQIDTSGPAVAGWPWRRCDNCMVIANWDTILRGKHHGNCAVGWPTEGVME